MKNVKTVLILSILLLCHSLEAQSGYLVNPKPQVSTPRASSLQQLVNEAARTALTKFSDKKLIENQLAITLIDLRDPQHPVTAS
ncbi:MAG: hypothetical protein DMF75_00915, partial [Acidobacteria bacterium]